MKKTYIIYLVILSVLIATALIVYGCMPKVENPIANLDQEIESVTFIFVGKTEEQLRVLEKDEIPEFLEELKAIPCRMITNDPPCNICDETIKLSFKDGSYMMINYMSQGTYKEGKVDWDAYYFEEELFDDLWKKYVNASNSE